MQPWLAAPLLALGPLHVLARYSKSWYAFDDWDLIARAKDCGAGFSCLMEPHNGHVFAGVRFLYWAQLNWLGVDNHRLVWGVFVLSLLALHSSLSWLLRGLGLSWPVSLTAAGLVTYLGLGSQAMHYQLLLSWNLPSAFSCLAAGIVVRTRAPTGAKVAGASGLLLLAASLDSSIALLGFVFVGLLSLGMWPLRTAIVALGVPALAHVVLLGHEDGGGLAGGVLVTVRFAFHLFFRGAGSLLVGDEYVGVLVVVASGLALLWLHRHQALPRRVLVVWASAMGAAGVTVVTIAAARAPVVLGQWQGFNRYIQAVALFVLIGCLAPLVLAGARVATIVSGRERIGTAEHAATAVMVGALLFGLAPLRAYEVAIDGFDRDSMGAVRQAVSVLTHGCPDGTLLDPDSRPSPDYAPQVSLQLLRRLLADGDLRPRRSSERADVVERICHTPPLR